MLKLVAFNVFRVEINFGPKWYNRSKWAKGSQNVKNNLIDHLGPLESKRSFQATFSDEIGRWEVSKPSYVLLLRLKVKLKVKIVSSFSFQLSYFRAIYLCMYSILPSIGHFITFTF